MSDATPEKQEKTETKNEERTRSNSGFYTRGLMHFKPSSAYKKGVKDDIAAWRETREKKAPVEPSTLPDEYAGIPCQMVEYTIPELEERKKMRQGFENNRKDFLKFLANEKEDLLLKEGLSTRQIAAMRKGQNPKGYNVHHILPIHGGGSNKFSNLCLIKARPYHEDIHNKFINPQLRGMHDGESRKIKLPRPKEAVVLSPDRNIEKINAEIARVEKARKAKQNREAKKQAHAQVKDATKKVSAAHLRAMASIGR